MRYFPGSTIYFTFLKVSVSVPRVERLQSLLQCCVSLHILDHLTTWAHCKNLFSDHYTFGFGNLTAILFGGLFDLTAFQNCSGMLLNKSVGALFITIPFQWSSLLSVCEIRTFIPRLLYSGEKQNQKVNITFSCNWVFKYILSAFCRVFWGKIPVACSARQQRSLQRSPSVQILSFWWSSASFPGFLKRHEMCTHMQHAHKVCKHHFHQLV